MGWTVLYIAFGIVALWLLGEVLLQYKAKLRWRVLAFAGFLGVVIGVLLASVAVIGLGALAFAVGQTFVTLSFRSGFSGGWALPQARRRAGRDDEEYEKYDDDRADGRDDRGARREDEPAAPSPEEYQGAENTAGYQPQAAQDDTNSYGGYDNSGYDTGGYPTVVPTGADGQQGYGSYDTYAGTGYDQQQYPGYADPYATQGGQGAQGDQGYGYDGTYGGQQQGYGQQGGYDTSSYAGYGDTTPPGGVWVPQQRGADDPYGEEQVPQQPQQQPYPYGYDEQYRY
ncbi:magnesium transporter [Streptomyces sp. UH6]|uniref:SLC41A family transporter n=1 Tax=Streptomyces sp. UH6 TaxID=2748379 RepID=UPI0015D4E2E7|nr:magnesium transporter [Streptomyces sp. UH6]NYV78157.1 magnesium transporter [Streptomyces sp. UH6]